MLIYVLQHTDILKCDVILAKLKNSNMRSSIDFNRCNGNVMHFYFKVNGIKMRNKGKLTSQLRSVVKRILDTHELSGEVKSRFGLAGDDFKYNKITLRISFDCA